MHTQGLSVCLGPLIKGEATAGRLEERERPDRVTETEKKTENEGSEEGKERK